VENSGFDSSHFPVKSTHYKPDSRSWKLATLAIIAQDIGSPVLVVENPVFWVWRMGEEAW